MIKIKAGEQRGDNLLLLGGFACWFGLAGDRCGFLWGMFFIYLFIFNNNFRRV